jgi:hypothetical protein
MVVRVKPQAAEYIKFVMILCPEGGFEREAGKREQVMGRGRYICAPVVGAVIAERDCGGGYGGGGVDGVGCADEVLVYDDLGAGGGMGGVESGKHVGTVCLG